MNTSPNYIFDLDGTLVDTAPDLLEALNHLMEHEGRSRFDRVALEHLVGRGLEVMIEGAFKLGGDEVDSARMPELVTVFRAHYGAHIADHSRPYPGVVETLEALKAAGANLAVLTNKPHAAALSLLQALDLTRFFGTIYGAGHRDYIKPDGRLIPEILSEIGGDAASTVMVGDSITDLETARNAQVAAVLVSYGYTPRPAAELGADAVVDHFADIPAVAAKLLKK